MTPCGISIIIPVKPGGSVSALQALKAADLPSGAVQVLVAEGRQPSRQRNLAAAKATGDIIYFLDDDSLIVNDALSRLEAIFRNPKIAVAGGPSLTPSTDSLWQRSFGAALSSWFGGGGVRNRYRRSGTVRETGDHELILCNLAFRKDHFLKFGGLDERLYPNEENELVERLLAGGLRCIHDPDLAVFRSQRPSYRAFVRQLFTYGRGRAEQTLLTGKIRFAAFIPVLFLLYLLLLPLADNPVYSMPLLCYGLMALAFAVADAVRTGDMRIAPLLFVVFPTLHLCYAAGQIRGMLRPRFRTRGAGPAEVTIREVTASVFGHRGRDANGKDGD